ncbi:MULTISPECIES: ASCH domain-containing protein [unclassified Methylibium]|uniref:ASCH domain-containing protein n=1 Tax=unclassified Methylibium TaxID=2633235 RepID=UPI000688A859|nr:MULTISPECIES: ASCH domain-containing protein [unclassified Methylibium]
MLLSIKPKYADLILSGTKTVELRRSWPSNDVGVMVIYSSAPIQRLTGIALITEIRECTPDALWDVAQAHGGGVTEDELKEYIGKKALAYGVMLGRVEVAEVQVDPKELFPNFTPPQGFLYLSPSDYQRVKSAMFPGGINL